MQANFCAKFKLKTSWKINLGCPRVSQAELIIFYAFKYFQVDFFQGFIICFISQVVSSFKLSQVSSCLKLYQVSSCLKYSQVFKVVSSLKFCCHPAILKSTHNFIGFYRFLKLDVFLFSIKVICKTAWASSRSKTPKN